MIDKRTLPRERRSYKEFESGFQVLNNDGVNIIDFEKPSVFTNPVLRDIIKERYKNGKILKVCRTCKNTCKQVDVKGVKFILPCYQQEKK